jgi:hypothetical protein
MNKKNLILIVILIVVVTLLIAFRRSEEKTEGNFDAFARCLAEKDVTMYAAEWCSHCQNQKKMFGEAFKLVPYVECPEETDKCLAAGIQGYPTWIFPDGKQLLGEQTLEKLAETSGCAF